jgi:anhydro-N-acetylmuramic acid kinase
VSSIRKTTGPVRALGAMSGTSLDGVDAAVLDTDGRDIIGFGPSTYRAYSDGERATIAAGFGQWSGPDVEAATCVVDAAHAEALAGFEDIDLVGFHGQTLAHAPRHQGTLQVGDGAALADSLGAPVVWDFRSSDVELGGVGNITWVDPRVALPETTGALLAFDTGPANAPINDLVQARCGVSYDKDGAIAASGTVAQGALELFLAEPYFARIPPKSLDRNDFSEMIDLVGELSDADAAATLTAMCAAGVVEALTHCPSPPRRVLVTGGGRNNPVLMRMLEVSLDCDVAPVEAVGLDGDMLEAQAFAYLAVRVARGLPTSCASTTGVRAAVSGGTLSRPQIPVI